MSFPASLLAILVLLIGWAFGAQKKPEPTRDDAQRAKEHFERGEYREAESIYFQLHRAHPKDVVVLSNLAVVRFRTGKLKLAEESLRTAIGIGPKDAFSRQLLGTVLHSQGRHDEALASLQRALDLGSDDKAIQLLLGAIYTAKGMHEEAAKAFEDAGGTIPEIPVFPEPIPRGFHTNEA